MGVGPAFSMQGKPREKLEEMPGPGDYDVPRPVATGASGLLRIGVVLRWLWGHGVKGACRCSLSVV